MASMSPIVIDCPDCHEPIEVPIKLTAEGPGNGRLVVSVEPDLSAAAEHYALDHA